MNEPHKVTKGSKIVFVVYDSRAHYAPDEACVLEAIDTYVNYERVYYKFLRGWGEDGAALYAYKEVNGSLTDAKHIEGLEDLKDL